MTHEALLELAERATLVRMDASYDDNIAELADIIAVLIAAMAKAMEPRP